MRRHVVTGIALMTLSFGTAIRAAEEASEPTIPTMYAEIQYMQVPEGGDELYLRVEEAWMKIHAARKDLGITRASMVCKARRTEGPESDYNYTVVHSFDAWDKIETPYPWDVITSRISITDEEQEIFGKSGESRKMLRTELCKLEDVAIPSRLGTANFDKTVRLAFMKSKRPGHLNHEKQVWKKIWEQACEDGLRSNWHLWSRRFPGGSEHAFNLVAVHFFPKGEFNKPFPENWWEKTGPKLFPKRNTEEITKVLEETDQIRDIPITEEWTIVQMVGFDE